MVRLLTLQPGEEHDPIVCEMESAYIRHSGQGLKVLDDNPLGEDPEYEALSYTWGHPKPELSITMTGEDAKIRTNLYHALRQLRRTDRPRKLWVNALYIEQTNLEENGIQIPRMF